MLGPVDRDAVRFLIRCESEGVVLRNCSAYIREWIKQEMNAMHREKTPKTRQCLAG